MLLLRKNKLRCAKTLLLILSITIALSFITNTMTPFRQRKQRRILNSFDTGKSGKWNTTSSYSSNNDKENTNYTKMLAFEDFYTNSYRIGPKNGAQEATVSKEPHNMTGHQKILNPDDGTIALSAQFENRKIGRSSGGKEVKNGQRASSYEEDEDDIYESSRNGVERKGAQVINKEWINSLRANTTKAGILKKRNLHWTISLAGTYSKHLFTPPPGEIPVQRFPQAIIIGVGHSGTRALIDFLGMHPNIVTSSNEIHFFDHDDKFIKGYEWYKEQMPLSYSNQITLEKTPAYIWSERALHEIYKMNKTIKLIVIMKNPVVRFVSMKLSYTPQRLNTLDLEIINKTLQVSFDSQTLRRSVYVKYLKYWFQKFHKSQIHVIDSSEFEKDPAKEIIQVETFLEIPHFITDKNFYFNKSKGFFCMKPLYVDTRFCLKEGKGRVHPKIDLEGILYDYYNSYNEELFNLLGKRFSWGPDNNDQSVSARSQSSNVSSISRDTFRHGQKNKQLIDAVKVLKILKTKPLENSIWNWTIKS